MAAVAELLGKLQEAVPGTEWVYLTGGSWAIVVPVAAPATVAESNDFGGLCDNADTEHPGFPCNHYTAPASDRVGEIMISGRDDILTERDLTDDANVNGFLAVLRSTDDDAAESVIYQTSEDAGTSAARADEDDAPVDLSAEVRTAFGAVMSYLLNIRFVAEAERLTFVSHGVVQLGGEGGKDFPADLMSNGEVHILTDRGIVAADDAIAATYKAKD